MNILFMCVANSARSQLAEALATSMCPSDFKIESAGSMPTFVNPFAVQVLSEIGIHLQGSRSKTVDELPTAFLNNLNYVITLCKEEVCPVYITSRVKKLHWPLPDPARKNISTEESLALFRLTRQALEQKIKEFLETL